MRSLLHHLFIVLLLLGVATLCRGEKVEDPFGQVALSPDGKQLFIGRHSGKVALIDQKTGENVRVFDYHKGEQPTIANSDDGKRMVTAPRNILAKGKDNVVVWETETGKQVWSFGGHTSLVMTAAISPDGKVAVSGDDDGTVIVWEAGPKETLKTFKDHKSRVTSIVISRDGKWLFTGAWDDTVVVYDFAKLEKVKSLSIGAGVYSLAVSGDGQRLMVGTGASKASLWDVAAGKELRTFEFHKHCGAELVALSADAKIVVTAGDNGPSVIWNAQTGERLHFLWGNHGGSKYGVGGLALSADGKRLASQSVGYVTLWDTEKGEDLELYHAAWQ